VPSLIPVSIRKYNQFIGMRREYLKDRVVRQSLRSHQICYL
jgi:hypothetical protein